MRVHPFDMRSLYLVFCNILSHMPLVTTPMLGRIDMQFNFATWQNRQIKSIHEETLIIELDSCKSRKKTQKCKTKIIH